MKAERESSRDWADVEEEDLHYMLRYESDKAVLRMARAELKKRQTSNPDIPNPAQERIPTNPMVIIGVQLSVLDWFRILFKAFPVILMVMLLLALVFLFIRLTFWGWFLNELFSGIVEQ